MKRLVGITIAIVLFLGVITLPATAQASDVKVEVNGSLLAFDQPPVIENGRTLVPFRVIFEALSMTVDYKEENGRQIVTAQQGEKNIRLIIGADEFYLNETTVPLDVPAKIINSRTLIPVRAIAESLDANVDWDDETRTVLITTDGTRLIKSRNLVNPAALSVGYVSKQTGEVIGTAANWRTSDFLEVQTGEIIVSENKKSENITIQFLAAYDENKQVVPSAGITRGGDGNGTTYIVPEGVNYIRLSVATNQAGNVDQGGWMVAVRKRGFIAFFEPWFEPYYGIPTEAPSEEPMAGDDDEGKKSPLYGKKVAWIGSSITQVGKSGGWCDIVSDYFGFDATNCGVGGTTMCGEDAASMGEKTRLLGEFGPVTDPNTGQTVIAPVPIPSDVDIIFVEAGTNDWARNWPMGEKEIVYDQDGNLATDKMTFYGAAHHFFKNAKELFPNAMVIAVGESNGYYPNRKDFNDPTGWINNHGLTILEYGDALCEVAEMWGCFAFNAGREMGITPDNIQEIIPDKLHPSGVIAKNRLAGAVIRHLLAMP